MTSTSPTSTYTGGSSGGGGPGVEPISGASGRQLTLLITNVILLGLGLTLLILGADYLNSYAFADLSFISELFLVTPWILIISGLLTIVVSVFGLRYYPLYININ